MEDYIISAIADDGFVRAYAATTRNLVETARNIHGTTPVATAALGRLMTAAVIMGSMLKGDEIITCRIRGDGELGGIIATADANGNVKGYPNNPYVDMRLNPVGKLDVARAIGKGSLNVSKDLGLKEPYSGEIPLVSSEIAEDFTYYFAKSEQTPSAVALGVLVGTDCSVLSAGGFIIQLMPGAPESTADILSARLACLPSVTSLLEEKTPQAILEHIFLDMNLEISGQTPANFNCNCNREKLASVVTALGRDEINDILSKEKRADLKCHFCGTEYCFSEYELRKILANI